MITVKNAQVSVDGSTWVVVEVIEVNFGKVDQVDAGDGHWLAGLRHPGWLLAWGAPDDLFPPDDRVFTVALHEAHREPSTMRIQRTSWGDDPQEFTEVPSDGEHR